MATAKQQGAGAAAARLTPRIAVPFTSKWPTPLVIVVASVSGKVSWVEKDDAQIAKLNASIVVYQRLNSSAHSFSPNRGFEAGVYLNFIVDHYSHLPEHTAFVQSNPFPHSPSWLPYLRCRRPDVGFASLVPRWIERDLGKDRLGGHGAVAEQCYRNLLDDFGASDLLPPRQEPVISGSCCAMFVASRAQLLKRPHSAYLRAHGRFAGGNGLCHKGPLHDDQLSTTASCETAMVEANRCCKEALRYQKGKYTSEKCNFLLFVAPEMSTSTWNISNACQHIRNKARHKCSYSSSLSAQPSAPDALRHDSPNFDKVHAVVFEQLHHVLLGGLPLLQHRHDKVKHDQVDVSTWCRSFLPRGQCQGSPCTLP